MPRFSNWREDLAVNESSNSMVLEVITDTKMTDTKDAKKVKEKKINNAKLIKINPQFKEAIEDIGGEILEMKEIDGEKEKEKEDSSAKQLKNKEKRVAMMKRQILMRKMMAVKQGAGADIVASYEPDIEGAIEYFYEEGINEEGIDQLIEEIGLEAFVDFVEGGSVELNEERAARKASVRAKKYDQVKAEVDKADAARKKAKKGEYAPSYAKKETDVTVYDDKPAAKKKAPAKKTVAKKAAPKPVTVKKTTTKKTTTKKVVKAVSKVKQTQPAKKATKQGLGDKIRSAYKAGVKRHRKATQGARVFGKGVAAGAKKAVKFAKDVKKVVSEEELIEGIKGEDNETRKAAAAERKAGVKTRLSPSEGRKNVANMLYKIRNAKSNLKNESVSEDKEYGYDKDGNSLNPKDKKAKKDFDGDGKLESPEAEYKGSKDKAIKKELKDLQKAAETGKGKDVAKADKVKGVGESVESDEYIDTVQKIKAAETEADIKRWKALEESGNFTVEELQSIKEADIADILARLEKKRISKGGDPEESPLPAMRKYHADKKKKKVKEEVEIDEGIVRAIKKAKRIGKRILDAHDDDPGRAHTIGTLGNPHVGNEDKRAAERKAGKKKVKEEIELDEAERSLADRLARKRKVYDKTLKKAMQFARDEGEASGHARYRMGSIDREMDGIKAKMNKEK